ncbi:TetR/AcrR family transcriptional regulator [Cryptosporangium phraense]|uniref:Helix-turn-helix transcriptional regulator n=1 Tax=Cryptosporangium phraense TaxID=2593070 RepID=A0A545ATQ7_9ACTN|nr:TetR family transcriptional regulator [Cryptosporangium phraense]TQS44712.1 helix-turn-helix transcriptional regulator [Cryptosporangium phraense]
MARVFRSQADQGILDLAASLFARYGYSQTSVQAVADAVGMSKAGLLHYFPSKDALRDAVVARSTALAEEVLAEVADLPVGPERDRRALEVLVDQALGTPGLTAYLLSTTAAHGDDHAAGINDVVMAAFGVGPDAGPERRIRVLGAIGALSVVAIAAHRAGKAAAWRSYLIATSVDALGFSDRPK